MHLTDLIQHARSTVTNLNVDDFEADLTDPHTLLLDVREPDEPATDGAISGAVLVPRGMLEFRADPASPYHLPGLTPTRRVRLYCKSGGRSALAAASLVAMGYTDVAHLDGGLAAWVASGRRADRTVTWTG